MLSIAHLWNRRGGTFKNWEALPRVPISGQDEEAARRAVRWSISEKQNPRLRRGSDSSAYSIGKMCTTREDAGKNRGWQRPTLPRGRPRSTIGAGRLNFRVRNVTGCTPAAIATNPCAMADRCPQTAVRHNFTVGGLGPFGGGRPRPLVPVSFTRCRASTSGLSTWSSTRGLIRLTRWGT